MIDGSTSFPCLTREVLFILYIDRFLQGLLDDFILSFPTATCVDSESLIVLRFRVSIALLNENKVIDIRRFKVENDVCRIARSFNIVIFLSCEAGN